MCFVLFALSRKAAGAVLLGTERLNLISIGHRPIWHLCLSSLKESSLNLLLVTSRCPVTDWVESETCSYSEGRLGDRQDLWEPPRMQHQQVCCCDLRIVWGWSHWRQQVFSSLTKPSQSWSLIVFGFQFGLGFFSPLVCLLVGLIPMLGWLQICWHGVGSG